MLLNTPDKLLVGNCYEQFPFLYDLLYQRYLKTIPTFVQLVAHNTPESGEVLDLAAGTGEVSLPLLQRGLKVTSLDASAGMLSQLLQKLSDQESSYSTRVVMNMAELSFNNQFDTVCIRQAINYFMSYEALVEGLKRIYDSLKPGGSFVFNAPNYQLDVMSYPIKESHYTSAEWQAFVVERNELTDRVLRHIQDSVVWNKQDSVHVHDENTFYFFTADEFSRALLHSGFKDITFYGSDLRAYNANEKTLYGVAKK